MSDRVYALVVSLETNMHEDDAQRLAEAIKCLRGVSAVEAQSAEPIAEMVTRNRLKHAMLDAVIKVLEPKTP